jgi:hypothetical protein
VLSDLALEGGECLPVFAGVPVKQDFRHAEGDALIPRAGPKVSRLE